MDLIQVIILGIVEGLTEFLPVSSTGHMILAQAFMGIESSEFVKAFTVIIQFGAILSVMVIYWKRFLTSWAFYLKLLVGVIPALALGYLLNDYIDALLGSVWVVASMLLIGGIVMLYIDKWFQARELERDVTIKNAFVIGLFQCIAMIPGVSRSLATIVGGLQQGLTRKTAAEFSF
ncbi:MAG: undecaprenyl-diphosphate phosphatase, partial [Tannerellaceae bacterium]